ncbi:MAG TPA: acyl-CoA dehydrogenase family protein [Burkholderiales bacterium]|nr:acyl-CoA dehydrogenase family protein [Burkholderiales bacterium]
MIPTELQLQIRNAARAFAQAEIVPRAAEWDRSATVPLEMLRAMGPLGLMGMCVAPEWGGAGADFVSYALAVEEIAAGDCGLCNMMCVNNSPNCAALEEHGTKTQKERFLKPLASGAQSSAFLLTEPHAGSDAAALSTRAAKKGDRWVLDGTKQFITAGRSADLAFIVAVTEPAAGRRGMSMFVAHTRSPGYRVAKEEDKLGHRSADTCQIALEGLEVPEENLLGAPGAGYRIALAYLENGRIGVAAQSVGVARAAYEAALRYAQQRESFGRRLVGHQAVEAKLADMATELEAARQLTLYAASLKDAGKPCLKEASMAKLFASEMAERVTSDAIQIHGGYGYVADFPVEKLWRDARVLSIYEGTSEIQRLVIGRALAASG